MQICKAHGSTAPAKCAAAAALEHLMRAHGGQEEHKQTFAAAGGLPAMVKLAAHPGLPLLSRARAAGAAGPRQQFRWRLLPSPKHTS
jgi:hypothetical protein